MNENEFKLRTKNIALRLFRLVNSLPKASIPQTIGKQLVRSGTSIGANYRAACRAKSVPDLINKLAIVEEEADESLYWLELLIDGGFVPANMTAKIYSDIEEIVAMVVASIKTLKSKQNPKSKI